MRAEVLADTDSGRRAISAPAQRSTVRYLAGVAALAGLYYGAAQVGYALDFAGPVAAIVWLPVGVGVSFLYLGGLRFWPGVLIGDLLANDYATLPSGAAPRRRTCMSSVAASTSSTLPIVCPSAEPSGSAA